MSLALESDKKEPLHIEADTVSIDNKAGTSRYEGHVNIWQGSSRLTSDTALVYMDKDSSLKKAAAKGNLRAQAHYKTLTDPQKPELNAYADIIEFYPKKHLIYLIGNAKVIQGKDSYKAPEIEYNTEKQRVFSKKSTHGRTVIVIHPSNSKH